MTISNKLIVLLGPPGSGKGTQCQKLTLNDSMQAIVMGDIVRSEIKNKSDFGQLMNKYLVKGDLVPNELINKIFLYHLSKLNNFNDIILDGFPRTIDQALLLSSEINSNFILIPILIDVSEELLMSRLLNRKRNDDKKHIILNRFKTYFQEIEPVIDYYGNKLIKIDGSQQESDVFKNIIYSIKNYT